MAMRAVVNQAGASVGGGKSGRVIIIANNGATNKRTNPACASRDPPPQNDCRTIDADVMTMLNSACELSFQRRKRSGCSVKWTFLSEGSFASRSAAASET